MAKQIGRATNVGIAKETTRGTAAASPSVSIPFSAITFDQAVDVVVDESAIGVMEDSLGQYVEKQMTNGNLEAKVDLNFMDVVLEHFFGTVALDEDEPQAGVDERVFTINQTTARTPLTFFAKDRNETIKFPLCFLQSMQITSEKGSFVNLTAPWVGNKKESATYSATYSAPVDFLFKHGEVKLAANQAGLGAASAINVRSFSITVNNNTEDDDAIGNDEAIDRIDKEFSFEISMTVTYNGPSQYEDIMTGDTPRALRFKATDTETTVGTSTNPSLQIDLYSIKFSSTPVSRGNNDVLTQEITAKAFYSSADSKSIEITTIH